MDDYNGYASTGVCDVGGNAVAGLGSYTVSMAVQAQVLSGVAVKRVQVTQQGGDSLVLSGLRSGYGS